MANNYLQFSEVIPHLTGEEEAWLRSQFEQVYLFGDEEYPEGEIPKHLDAEEADWIGPRGWRDAEDRPEGEDFLGFQHQFHDGDDRDDWGRYLWIFAEECGEPERVVHLVQKFLRQFRPGECWSLSYAMTCSKPRVGEFGGGAIFVTADAVQWDNAYRFIGQCRAEFQRRHEAQGEEVGP